MIQNWQGLKIVQIGPDSVYDIGAPNVDERIWNSGIPILVRNTPALDHDLTSFFQAICYGYQLVAKYFGGRVEKKKMREDGQFAIEVRSDSDPALKINKNI